MSELMLNSSGLKDCRSAFKLGMHMPVFPGKAKPCITLNKLASH